MRVFAFTIIGIVVAVVTADGWVSTPCHRQLPTAPPAGSPKEVSVMALDRRVRLLGAALRRATGPVATMPESKRRALRHRKAPRHLTNLVNGKRVPGVTTTDVTIDGASGPLRTRVYRPAGSRSAELPVVVAFHGGGWMFGNLDTAEWLYSEVAARVPAIVVAGTYRLAPEHRAPAALNDALATTAWAAETAAELGGSPERVAVMGESSGATLAAAVALMARDSGAVPLQFQALIYPITDLTLSSPSVEEMSQEPVLSSSDLRAYVDAYLGPDGCSTDPYVSPLLAADHRGLPPALVIGADHDPLRDDARRYADRLRACSVPVRGVEMSASPHGFFSFPHLCHASGPALKVLVDELRRSMRCPRATKEDSIALPVRLGAEPADVGVRRPTNGRNLPM